MHSDVYCPGMKTHYEAEANNVFYIVATGEDGWLRQVTPSGDDGGTIRNNGTYTVTAGEAMIQIESETPELAAELATLRLREILSTHVSLDDPDYPTELNVKDNASGIDYGFTL